MTPSGSHRPNGLRSRAPHFQIMVNSSDDFHVHTSTLGGPRTLGLHRYFRAIDQSTVVVNQYYVMDYVWRGKEGSVVVVAVSSTWAMSVSGSDIAWTDCARLASLGG